MPSYPKCLSVIALSVGKATGNNGMAVIVIDNRAFRWIRGEDKISTWKKPDVDWQTWFCQECGSSLPGIEDESHMYIPAGLISLGGETLKVTHHIWVDSKAVWDEIGDSGKQHRGSFQS